ncbi:translocator protein, LysE family [Bacteriovorax sp. BSW11_IV]|uniref:LysE family translocator n=1 Tax=Bacteriovorax sp. BSW11_IV TaxID=1353529 RepID=UPI000389E7CE|nr:LysE family transporter [Bacteriovorax sp. BSW11_IV]EQC45173.1 translocator protein, LysE family [Bacteriovorax sp. BSW11_IV]
MIALLTGLIIGFLMCIPIGPINVWVVNTQIKKGVQSALAIAFGGSLMDFIYFFIIVSGLSLFEFSDNVSRVLQILGIIFIFSMGVKELFFTKTQTVEKIDSEVKTKTLIASFFVGVVLYTSNPTLIITMTGLGAFVKSLGFFEFSKFNIFFLSFGLALGSFLWFVFLSYIVHRYQESIRTKYMKHLVKVSGVLMVGLGSYMGARLIL